MLVKGRMSAPIIATTADTQIMEAMDVMKKNNIRRMPVLDKDSKLIGIVSDKDLLNAAPSDATSLSVWEVNYLVARIKVKDVMTADVMTVAGDTPVEEAARMMADSKIGGLPVMLDDEVVGLITETDLFKLLVELMGAREMGVRVTATVPDKLGELDDITHAIAKAGGSFIAFGQFNADDTDHRIVTFKVTGMTSDEVVTAVSPVVDAITDMRECCS